MGILSERLKAERKRKKLTQEQVASKLGVSKSSIALYETAQRNPDPDMINKLADFYDVSADYLLGRTDDPTPNINQVDDASENNTVDLANKKIKPTFQGRELTPEQMKKLRYIIQHVLFDSEEENKD